MDSVTQCVGALREAAAVNVPECRGPELGASAAWNPMRAAEIASGGEDESAHAAGSKREDSGLTKRTDLATPASEERWADLSDECGECKEYISNYRKLATKTVYLQHEQQHER